MANVHFRRGELEPAAEAYRRALEIKPRYLLARYHYGWVLRQLNRSDEAEREFRQCLDLPAANDVERHTQVECLFYLGTLRSRAGDHATAATLMERVVQADPQRSEAHYYLGMAYRHLGRDADARRELDEHARLLRERRRTEAVEREDDP